MKRTALGATPLASSARLKTRGHKADDLIKLGLVYIIDTALIGAIDIQYCCDTVFADNRQCDLGLRQQITTHTILKVSNIRNEDRLSSPVARTTHSKTIERESNASWRPLKWPKGEFCPLN